MNAKETHELVDRYCMKPVLKTYELTDYDRKYRFKGMLTEKQLKKAGDFVAAENEKLKAEYLKETRELQRVHDIIDRAGEFPKEVAYLFWSVFDRTVDGIVRRYDAYRAAYNKVLEEFGEDGIRAYNSPLKYELSKTDRVFTGRQWRSVSKAVETDDAWWEKLVESSRTNWHKDEASGEYRYDYPLRKIADWKKLVGLCQDLKWAYDRSEAAQSGKLAYEDGLRKAADTVERVMEDVKEAFGGRCPDGCDTDPDWGIDGRFNAVLRLGDERVSFKSFGAGGWNIQRYHFRAKATKLKRR